MSTNGVVKEGTILTGEQWEDILIYPVGNDFNQMFELKNELKKGWSNHYSVVDSRSVQCGNMICRTCEEKIEGYYLLQDRTNYILRGNEHDEVYLYCRKCSESNDQGINKWSEFDKEQKTIREFRIIKESKINEVKKIIEKYGFDPDDIYDNITWEYIN